MTQKTPNSQPSYERMNPMGELVLARLREFYREPGIVFWVFGFPLLMAIALGMAFRSRPPELPHIAVVRADDNPATVTLVRALTESKRIVAVELSEAEAKAQLAHAKVDCVAEVKEDSVEYVYDRLQEKSEKARLTADSVAQMAAGRRDPLLTRDREITDVGSRYIDFLIPGLIGLNLMGSSMWGVGYNLVLARKRKLLRRYAVTPMKRVHFLLSYFVSRSAFLALELSVLIGIGSLLFGTVIQGSVLTVLLLGLLGAASFSGISLLIGARIENTEAANGLMNVVQLPMWMLSGTFFSYERFPEFLQLPIKLLPLTALVNALRAVYNEAASLTQVLPEVALLLAWGGVGFFFALRKFRWQ